MRDVDPTSNLDSLIDAAHSGDEPSGEDRDRVRKQLFARIASGAAAGAVIATSSSTATATAASTATVVVKVLGALALVGAVTATATVAVRERSPSAARATVNSAPHGARAPSARPSSTAPTQSSGAVNSPTPSRSIARATAPVSSPEPARAQPALPTLATVPSLARPARAQRPVIVATREAPEPSPSATERTVIVATPSSQPSTAPSPGALTDEVSLIASARSALARGDARSALGELDRYAQRFSRGMLRPESLAARVDALCALGDRERARAVAEAFVAEFPSSALAARVRSRCP